MKVINNDKLISQDTIFLYQITFIIIIIEKYAINLIRSASQKFPSNLLINQFKKILISKEINKNIFNCNNSTHMF